MNPATGQWHGFGAQQFLAISVMVMMHVSWCLGRARAEPGHEAEDKAGDTTREQHIASDMVVHNGRSDESGLELRAQSVRSRGRVHEKGLRACSKAAATYGKAATDSHDTAATDSQNTAATDSHSTAAIDPNTFLVHRGQGKEARKLMAREAGPKDDSSQTPGQARNRLL